MPDTRTEMETMVKPDFLNSLSRLFKKLGPRKHFGFGRTISILIDDQSIQLVTSRRIWNKSRLLDVTKIYIPSSYDTLEKRQDFITGEVEKYIHEHRSMFTRFILGVDGVESAVRVLSFPKMPASELSKALFWEGNKQTPFGLEEAYYGYQLMDPDKVEANANSNICLVAIPKREINNRLDELKTDIRISGVHYSLEAIGFLLRHIEGYSPEKTYVLINIKRAHTEISFYRGIRLEFKHISALGSGSLSKSGAGSDGFIAFTENLAQEIQNTLDFYVGQFSRASTETAYLYGDLSYSEEMIAKLTAHFGIEFQIFPVPHWLKSQPEANSFSDQIPVALKAVALAMVDNKLIDLSPPDLKEERAIQKCHRWAIPAFTLTLVMLLVLWMSQRYQMDRQKSLLDSATGQIEQFSNSASFIMYNKIKQQLAANKDLLDKLSFEPTFLHLSLKEISHLTPEAIRLSSYQLEKAGSKYSLLLEGQAHSTGMPPEVTLAEYIARLEGSPFFENVTLRKYIKKTESEGFVLDFFIETDAII